MFFNLIIRYFSCTYVTWSASSELTRTNQDQRRIDAVNRWIHGTSSLYCYKQQLFYENSPAHVTQLYNIVVAINPHRLMQLWMNEKKEELLN